LPVWEIELAERSGGPAVVLLHGWGRSRIDMLSRLAPFLEVAERVLLVDLRGHGDATGRTTLGDGDEADIAELLRRLPAGPVVLVGHSLGAVVALRTAASEPDRVAGVIAIAPYDTFETPLRMRLAARELPSGLTVRLAVGVLRLLGVRRTSGLAAARAVRCPLLVLQGGRDRISPPAEAAAIAEAGRGRLETFLDAEHADHEFREPARFAACCRDFVAGVARERTTGGLGEAARRVDVDDLRR
jgi:pimeloyl-ACP methyl ester carboxylesterase